MQQILNDIDNVSYQLTQVDSSLNQRINDVYNQLVDRINQGDVTVANQVANLSQVIDSVKDGTIEIIDPCGQDDFSQEILLKKGSGELLALYYTGGEAYLASLSDGRYRTTDSRSCNFTITNGSIQ